jgi:hypothetical protein
MEKQLFRFGGLEFGTQKTLFWVNLAYDKDYWLDAMSNQINILADSVIQNF